jgi:hypothetical protein
MEAFLTHRQCLASLAADAKKAPVDMPVADFSRYIDFLAGSQITSCVFSGGEPTLHPDIGQLVALARKKKVSPLVETYGVMLDEVLELFVAENVPVCWRLLHPRFYTAEERERMVAAAKRLGRPELPLCVLVMASEERDDYGWAEEFLRGSICREVVVRSLPSQDLAAKRNLAAWTVRAVPAILQAGGRVVLDCGLQACAFSDEEYGRLSRHGVSLQGCVPRPGVGTDMRVYHCREMMDFPGAPLGSFRNAAQVREYFFRRHNEMQWDYQFFPECPPCPTLRFANCQGPCMGIKARRLTAEAERLKEAVAQDGAVEPLTDLGRILLELSRFSEAEQCLVEARRLEPSRGEVHLLLGRVLAEQNRLGDAEEEYRKASRLLPAGHVVLAECGRMLHERGKATRARRVLEEAKAMARERAGREEPQP